MCLPGQPPRSAADPATPPRSDGGGSDGGGCASGGGGSGERGGRGGDGPRRAGVPRRRGYGVAAGRGAGRVPARVGAGRVAAHRGAGRGVSRVHVLRRLRGRRAGLSKGMAAVADPDHQRRGGRARSGGRGGWPPTPRSARRWRRGRSRRRGRGRSAPGPPSSPKATRRTPMRSCWRPRRAARNWRIWPGWRRRCAAAARSPTATMVAGSRIGGCGWTGPAWRGPGGRGPDSAVHRCAGRGAGRVQQESRPRGHPDYGPAPP